MTSTTPKLIRADHGSDVPHDDDHKTERHEHEHGENGCHLAEACGAHLHAAFESKPPLFPPSEPAVGTSTGHFHGNARPGMVAFHHIKKPAKQRAKPIRLMGILSTARRRSSAAATKFVLKAPSSMADSTSHAMLNVTGMNCSGCANNLTMALKGTMAFTMCMLSSSGELPGSMWIWMLPAVEKAIQHAKRATGYKLTPFSADTQTLEILMDPDTAKRFIHDLPRGVEKCENVSKTRYEVNYDPCLLEQDKVLSATGGGLLSAGRRKLIDTSIKMTLALIVTIPVVVLAWSDVSVSERTKQYVSIVLETLVQAVAYPEFYKPAISTLIYNHILEMDMLIVIAITAAYGYSVVAFRNLDVVHEEVLSLPHLPSLQPFSLIKALVSKNQHPVSQAVAATLQKRACGDGTNDAVAVAQANVGVPIESSNVTRATADVVLLSDLEGIVHLLDVSEAAFRRVIFNFVWSAIYNVFAILLAAGAFVKVRIPPAYAGLGEIVSVLPVVVAALTMPKVKTASTGRP
ncbi:uncharacterized protein Z518_02358 [Rhinocladiella mackenziei CBS 650.93]|uniref:Rhinocladiella mackenziei CBS 650.93 unplaced genomic scaffold supercont1.2, whole genome shotgun sequence n=1 Tax=Rhinocladiella mackenziei CBS 650.93 TaxID=1442369 RepID=A0A0D2IPA9_9EURO|nr:uncharacterized protein Z518_02358 [Rhinocladiella mackenziei CBS 650.93]KIX07704.1 hypothetical protein Z518_02358 [Rhinocladiella mackenziei CBS 650.93]